MRHDLAPGIAIILPEGQPLPELHHTKHGIVVGDADPEDLARWDCDTMPVRFADGVLYEVYDDGMESAFQGAAERYPEFKGLHHARSGPRYEAYMALSERLYREAHPDMRACKDQNAGNLL